MASMWIGFVLAHGILMLIVKLTFSISMFVNRLCRIIGYIVVISIAVFIYSSKIRIKELFGIMKDFDLMGKIGLNLMKIWGAIWLGIALSLIPYNVLNFFIDNGKVKALLIAFMSCFFAMGGLFFMTFRESYKEEHIKKTVKFHILAAIIPAFLHMIISIISFGNVWVVAGASYFNEFLAGMDVEAITISDIFLTSIIFDTAYAVSIWLGSYFGRKKRRKDRNKLTGEL